MSFRSSESIAANAAAPVIPIQIHACFNTGMPKPPGVRPPVNVSRTGLVRLASGLTNGIVANLRMIERNYRKHARMHIQCTDPRHSKPIIDRIDFVVNCDLKYRLGKDSDGV
jgi:hypothetical protein